MRGKLEVRLLSGIAVLILLSMACALPVVTRSGGGSSSDQMNSQTEAVQTIEAMKTEVVSGSSSENTPEPGAPEETQAPEVRPSDTPEPTATRRPTWTPYPSPTVVVLPKLSPVVLCDQAAFVKDISVPDGTEIAPGTVFDKTWRIRNAGSCTWDSNYALVFDSGDKMSGSSELKLSNTVAPGETIDLTVRLTAPTSTGIKKGYWKLRNENSVLFGLGVTGKSFYVEINVKGVTPVPTSTNNTGVSYDFTTNYCNASWTGNSTTLPCLGVDGDSNGFVLYRANPILETGYVDNEAALITNPPSATDAVIRGKFPAYTVKSGDHFMTILGCDHDAKNCNVRFQLDYQIGSGSIQTWKSWTKSYDNSLIKVDEDLSSLAGQSVQFILTVFANGASNQDRAQWLHPRIISK